MESFKSELEAYGADYALTINRFMGNETMYLKLLDMLFQDKSLAGLQQALTCGDLFAAFDAAHTLKGVTANLGLTPLYEAICDLTEPLRRKEALDYSQLYQAVEAQFQAADRLRQRLRTVQSL